MTRYYSSKGAELDGKINEYVKKLGEGPHIQQLITRAQNDKQKLFRESKEKIAEIEIKFKADSAMELIGLARVIPDLEANIRTEVEHAGMNVVIEHERKRAATEEERKMIRDVSSRDCGYDVESFSGRCIEVKSFAKTGAPRITSHEWETARRLQNDYWLYIVENAMDKPQVHTFQNPYEKFKDKVRKEIAIEYRYIIDNWK